MFGARIANLRIDAMIPKEHPVFPRRPIVKSAFQPGPNSVDLPGSEKLRPSKGASLGRSGIAGRIRLAQSHGDKRCGAPLFSSDRSARTRPTCPSIAFRSYPRSTIRYRPTDIPEISPYRSAQIPRAKCSTLLPSNKYEAAIALTMFLLRTGFRRRWAGHARGPPRLRSSPYRRR